MTAPALLTSAWDAWTTPEPVITRLLRVGFIGLDPCSNPASEVPAATRLMLERGDDGLAADWAELAAGRLVYCNPPYGRVIADWMKKCTQESGRGCEVIALVPARVDAAWFQRWVFECADSVAFWRGRLRFGNPPPGRPQNGSTFPSAVVYWGRRPARFKAAFLDAGPVFDVARARQAELEV
jgi:phage N-6-adenine-methyltransferase